MKNINCEDTLKWPLEQTFLSKNIEVLEETSKCMGKNEEDWSFKIGKWIAWWKWEDGMCFED